MLGALHGYGNGRELAATARGLVAIAGTACSLGTIVSLLAGHGDRAGAALGAACGADLRQLDRRRRPV